MELPLDTITGLTNLLRDDKDDSDSEDEKPNHYAKITPGDLGPKKGPSGDVAKEQNAPTDPNSIWSPNEVPEGPVIDNNGDPRLQPEYDIHFKQSVTAEDIYLGLGNKNPSTASCEEMVIVIKLPDEDVSKMNLDIKEQMLDLRAPKYKLALYLPNPVEKDKGSAEWDPKLNQLKVTLRNKRWFDFANF